MNNEKSSETMSFAANTGQASARRSQLESSGSYRIVKGISTVMDQYHLDPVVGLLFPGFGDVLSSGMTLPFLYFSLFRVKSATLTLAILYNTLMDALLGLFPVVGDVVDFFHKGSKKNYQLIVGFVENDESVVKAVRKRSFFMLVMIFVLLFAIYWIFVEMHVLFNSIGDVWHFCLQWISTHVS